MLGRTDSRRRLLVVLVVVPRRRRVALQPPRLVAGRPARPAGGQGPAPDHGPVRRAGPARHDLRPDRDGRPGHDRRALPGGGLARPADAEPSGARSATRWSAILGLDPDAGRGADRQDRDRPGRTSSSPAGSRTTTADRIRAGGRRTGRSRRSRSSPRPSGSIPQAGGAAGTTLAAHLLGFVNRDGEGQYGVEERYQAELAGTPRELLAERDVVGRPITDTAQVISPGRPRLGHPADDRHRPPAGRRAGGPGRLHRRRGGQRLGHRHGPDERGDPGRGELSVVRRQRLPDDRRRRTRRAFVDPIVSSVYEPGSVFKMFTAMAALEQGTIEPVDQDPRLRARCRSTTAQGRIYDADRARQRAAWTARDIVAFSRNVGAARIALGLANTTAKASRILAGAWVRLGFGQKTGVDLAGEAPGLVRDPALKHWSQVDLANGSFGQGVAVTQLQLVTGLRGDGQRREARHAPRRARRRRPRRRAGRPRSGHVAGS